jgi:predicted nucleotidyltransferase
MFARLKEMGYNVVRRIDCGRADMAAGGQVNQQQMAAYRATAQRRQEQEQQDLAQRRDRAWEVARQAAEFLRTRFGATRVVAFGSLAHRAWFSPTSDIDLAVWGLVPDDYLVAVAQLQDLEPQFKIDLISAEHCRPELRAAIAEEGEPL